MSLIQLLKPTRAEYVYIKGLFDFDELVEGLRRENYEVASVEEIASERVVHGNESEIANRKGYVREGVIYTPEGVFITKKSPILFNLKKATDCHKAGEEFYISSADMENALSDSVQIWNPRATPLCWGEYPVPNSPGFTDEVSEYLFGKNGKRYEDFIKSHWTLCGKISIKISYITAEAIKKPFARQLWLGKFDMNGKSSLTGHGNGVFGKDKAK